MSNTLEVFPVKMISGQLSAFELEICYFLENVFGISKGVGSEKE